MNSQAFLNQNLLKKDIENKNMNEQLRKLSSLLHYCNYNYKDSSFSRSCLLKSCCIGAYRTSSAAKYSKLS